MLFFVYSYRQIFYNIIDYVYVEIMPQNNRCGIFILGQVYILMNKIFNHSEKGRDIR